MPRRSGFGTRFKRQLNELLLWVLCRRGLFQLNLALYRFALRGIGAYTGSRVTDRRFLKNHAHWLPEKPTILDVGANVGEYVDLCLKIRPQAEIWAFEPQPDNFRSLTHFRDRLPPDQAARLHLQAIGLSHTMGVGEIFDIAEAQGTGRASVYRESITELEAAAVQADKIELTTIDEFLATQPIQQIHLLKIDTQGHELSILQGAIQAIRDRRINIIQFEFDANNVFSRVFYKDFTELLSDFRLYRILYDGSLVELRHYRPDLWEIFATHNTCAVRHDLVSPSD